MHQGDLIEAQKVGIVLTENLIRQLAILNQ
jgi:hypothetical protein